MKNIISFLVLMVIICSCSESYEKEKGFDVLETNIEGSSDDSGMDKDSVKFKTQPSKVVLTGIKEIRLITEFKVNYNKKREVLYVGSNEFRTHYQEEEDIKKYGNNWNSNIVPGFSALCGFNMVNVSYFNYSSQTQKKFFNKPVLVKTLYYPSFLTDTLNFKPVKRNYFMISCYDEDTNKDGKINIKDLRRFYYFDLELIENRLLIPENYSVTGSDYDQANDFMLVYAKLDANNNGIIDKNEEIHVFWIDLNNPEQTGKLY
jgi:hypothetical protein